jgi:signal transduction histidine kinase
MMPHVYEAEKCFQELADAIVEPVCVVRPDGRLLYGNRRWHSLTTISEGDDCPAGLHASIHPDDRQRWIEVRQHAMRSRHSYEVERRVRFAPDKDYVSQFEHGYPVRDAGGKIVEWVLIVAADDEQQRLIETLRRSLTRKDEFIAAVAHEMRGPLAPIASALKLLERRSTDPVLVINTCGLISRQVAQLVRLVDDLLDVARLEHRQLSVRNELLDLREVLTAAIEMALPAITARRHQLATTVTTDAVAVRGDGGRLTQIVVNLLTNAAKFTNEGGRIALSLEKDGFSARVRVRDTGIGISRETLPIIFEAFVQAENGAAEARTGLGLGLALARQLAQLHGGTLTAHSDGIDEGSEFVLHLPTTQAAHDDARDALLRESSL